MDIGRKNQKSRGFTLIELMVVMVVIAIVSLVGLASNYLASQGKARDSERKSDLNQYRIALETYASQHDGVYPIESSSCQAHLSTCVCGDLSTTYLKVCLQDPKQGSTYNYNYQTDTSGTKYILWARLEAAPGTKYWYVCSDGRASEKTSQPTASDCGIT